MIIQCNKDNISQVFEYIGDDYEKCLYLYIDLVKYGIENENFNIWIQYSDNEIVFMIDYGDSEDEICIKEGLNEN